MTRDALRTTCLLLALLAPAVPSSAQPPQNDPCGSPAGGFNFWVQYRLCSIARGVPKETQVEAPSSLHLNEVGLAERGFDQLIATRTST